ncbi:hypothetical protein FOMPIDRAFT_1016727 [Fomitopsis schrenkii]|uniref:Uncharacterized protein n=1 Tax=Fomitopsis schrenkii TaxID=2126942 RepID=S8E4E0_FOMSC|nr:hypothetical protein FOMPIDRAFT_1016727 [Fomitopsis schrenkii]
MANVPANVPRMGTQGKPTSALTNSFEVRFDREPMTYIHYSGALSGATWVYGELFIPVATMEGTLLAPTCSVETLNMGGGVTAVLNYNADAMGTDVILKATEKAFGTIGAAIIEVDNTTFVPWNNKRAAPGCEQVRITTSDFDSSSVFIFDASHMPYGCSISGVSYTGTIGVTNCNAMSCCHFMNQNSYGPGFAASGGGVFATLFDDTQIAIFLWPWSSVPAVDISKWGTPSANYTSSACNIGTLQQLVLDVTLCGDWAGVASISTETGCAISGGSAGNTSSCYLQNVINNGNTTAYFEINYIKAFNRNGTVLGASGATSSVFASATSAASKGANGTGSEILSYVLCLANIYK